MNVFASKRQRVRQFVQLKMPRDFTFGPFSFIALLLISGAGLAVEFARQGMEARHLAYGAGAVLAAAALISARCPPGQRSSSRSSRSGSPTRRSPR